MPPSGPGVEVLRADSFASDAEPIFINRPLCSGGEGGLLACPLSLGTHMCPLDHSLDAAVHCISKCTCPMCVCVCVDSWLPVPQTSMSVPVPLCVSRCVWTQLEASTASVNLDTL